MPGDQEITAVEVITRNCRYTGLVPTQGYRVSDILSDPSTDMLEMRETLTSVVAGRPTEVRWKQLVLKKDRILLVIPRGGYEAPTRRRNRYVEKHRYGAMIVLPGHVLSGIVHLPPRTTPLMLLDEESSLPTFMGVTGVTVHSSIRGLGASRLEVAIVRRSSIESVQLTAQPLPKRERTTEAAETETLSPS